MRTRTTLVRALALASAAAALAACGADQAPPVGDGATPVAVTSPEPATDPGAAPAPTTPPAPVLEPGPLPDARLSDLPSDQRTFDEVDVLSGDMTPKSVVASGAGLVVASSVSGGRLMAAAVRQQAVPHFLEDLLTFGKGLRVAERVVRADEEGKFASELPDLSNALIIGVARGEERWTFQRLAHLHLEPHDVIVYLAASPTGPGTPPA